MGKTAKTLTSRFWVKSSDGRHGDVEGLPPVVQKMVIEGGYIRFSDLTPEQQIEARKKANEMMLRGAGYRPVSEVEKMEKKIAEDEQGLSNGR